jgi:hypothetical protein
MRLQIIHIIKQYRGTSIGVLFSALSFISLFIFVPPLLAVFFGGLIELMGSAFIGSEPYDRLAMLTIHIHLAVFVLCTILLIRLLDYNQLTKRDAFRCLCRFLSDKS